MQIPECCICYSEFNNTTNKPCILDCGHSICNFCTDKIKTSSYYYFSSRSSTYAYPCPICKNISKKATINYDFLKLIEEVPKKPPIDPVVKTLSQSLEAINKQTAIKCHEYSQLEKNIFTIKKDIDMLEKKHHPYFDQYFAEVVQDAEKQKYQIIKKANDEAKAIKEKSHNEYNEIIRNARIKEAQIFSKSIISVNIKIKEKEEELSKANKRLTDFIFMEQMIKQHKRNFVTQYDNIMKTLIDFSAIMKDVNITYKGKSNSAKKDIYKCIEKIKQWDVEKFICKLDNK
jgi:hypothetical protein